MTRVPTWSIPATGSVGVGDSYTGGGSVAPFVVGDPPQWADDSIASYASLETFEHPDVSYFDSGNAEIVSDREITSPAADVTMFARIQYECMSADMKPPTARVYSSGNAFALVSGSITGAGANAPTWVDIPLAETDPGRMQQLINRLNDKTETVSLYVYAAPLRVYSFRLSRTRVYEAALFITTGTHTAPPCRLFPRADDLGVGGGRRFPPPKSQQRSGRRFGYY